MIFVNDAIVITGPLDFPSATLESSDNHALIVFDLALTAALNQEFDRLWPLATAPKAVFCP